MSLAPFPDPELPEGSEPLLLVPVMGAIAGYASNAHLCHVIDEGGAEEGIEVGWCLYLPWSANPLPANKPQHGHWSTTAKAVKTVRHLANSLVLRQIPRQARIAVRLDQLVKPSKTARDEDNLGLLAKALTDGLRDSRVVRRNTAVTTQGIIPDDTRQHVVREHARIFDLPDTIVRHATIAPAQAVPHFRLWIFPLPAAAPPGAPTPAR